ncbi:MAG: serine hydrolase [Prolixibacteraceae bacterium]|nr:serine hydrolase [Prolixibacteraceae bacterium]MBN2772801.1 serine hydrolase [Prolixibacteraceae bacterium]
MNFRISLLVPLFLFLLVAGCKNETSNKKSIREIAGKISYFENNLNVHITENGSPKQSGEKATLKDRMANAKAAGLDITLIDNYKIEWQKSYGYLKNGNPDKINENTVFQSGSVCKFVTALIIMHYAEKGIFDLDTDINDYLTSWKMLVNAFNRNIPVTVRHLLSHQSGLPGTNFGRDTAVEMPTIPQILDASYPAKNEPAYPVFTPGEKWAYSNIAYVVLQLILEDTFQKSFNDIAREIIFEPLKMDHSTFQYPLPDNLAANMAFPHSSEGEPRQVVQDSRARAQGGMFTTTTDMAKLLIEVMNSYHGKSEKIVNQKTLREMVTPQIALPIGAFGIPLDNGLGIFLEGGDKYLSLVHPGHSYPGSYFFILAFPETGQGMVLAQNDNSGDLLDMEIVSALAELYNWPGGQYFK